VRVFKVFVLLGGMGVEMKGGMTGGMKIEESLYLKGSAPSDGRDGELFAYSQQKSERETKLFDAHQQDALNFQKAKLYNE
jgi:hypothetical protein